MGSTPAELVSRMDFADIICSDRDDFISRHYVAHMIHYSITGIVTLGMRMQWGAWSWGSFSPSHGDGVSMKGWAVNSDDL